MYPGSDGDDAFFTVIPTPTATATLTTNINFNSITFNVGGYTIPASGAFLFDPSGGTTITSSTGVVNTISAPIQGASFFHVMGSGELILSGTDTFGGLVVIDGGNLVVTSSGSIDNGGSGTTVGSVNNHSIVGLFGSMTTAGATIGFSNDNSVTVSGLGSLWSMTGDLQLGSNTGSDNSLNVVNGGLSMWRARLKSNKRPPLPTETPSSLTGPTRS